MNNNELTRTIRALSAYLDLHTCSDDLHTSKKLKKKAFDYILSDKRKQKLSKILDQKSLFVILFVSSFPTKTIQREENEQHIFLSALESFSSLLTRIRMAKFLDQLATKYRIIFAPSSESIVDSECDPQDSDFTEYDSQSQLFHSCEISSIGLQMQTYSTVRVLRQVSSVDLLGMSLLSRVVLTTSVDLYEFCKSIDLVAIHIGFSQTGSIIEMNSTIGPSYTESYYEFCNERSILSLMKIPVDR
jgi:hypothetical protein